jgi:hypothetical protein
MEISKEFAAEAASRLRLASTHCKIAGFLQ